MISYKATNHAKQPRSKGQGDNQKETTLESKSEYKAKTATLTKETRGKRFGIKLGRGETIHYAKH